MAGEKNMGGMTRRVNGGRRRDRDWRKLFTIHVSSFVQGWMRRRVSRRVPAPLL